MLCMHAIQYISSNHKIRMHIACTYVMRSSTTSHAHASSAETLEESQEACLLMCYDQWWVSCVSGAVANCTHSLRWKKPLLSLLSNGSSLGSEEGSGDQQIMTNLLNEAFSAKATNLENTIKNPMTSWFQRINEICNRFRGNRWIDRHTHTLTKWLV